MLFYSAVADTILNTTLFLCCCDVVLQEILARIKDGRLKFVVATELAARGLDIPELSHVINFELPTDAQHYVHR